MIGEAGKMGEMDRDQVWQVIDAQRDSLADLLGDLSDDQWRQPSLCTGWTVRDVAAHLTLQQIGLGAAIAMMAQWRGSLDRTVHHVACRRAAALSTAQIIAQIRGMAGSRRHNVGVTYLETLTDILVHGQDIAVPLGLRHDMPAPAAAVAAGRLLSMRWPRPLPATRKVAGFRLVAADTPWSAGQGPEVRAPMSALLLLCAGRHAALPDLSGPGADALTARLSPSATA
ncbi:maleylpyruvate isomerase family mycothiol-dependent enzyme [Actinomadura sp. 9N215]|uniref:maleylpyruvate isomerase family mycothiol-dependent enzyme n=1 Tax=Actinomadura sp. 9N215 TaxID=3375150 RepID=UPI00378A3C8D